MDLLAFVLMPFRKGFIATYNSAVAPSLRARGLTSRLAPDIRQSRDVMANIHQGIWESRLVIADLTGLNANVLYELGIASALNKPTILISQNVRQLAFDVRRDQVVCYTESDKGRAELARELSGRVGDVLGGDWSSVPSWKEKLNADIMPVSALLWIESTVQNEVWVIEPEESFQDKAFHDVIVANLRRGVRYRFIVSARKDVERAFKTSLGEFYGAEAQVLYVPEKDLRVPLSLAIFEPMRPGECGYQYLPNGKTIYGVPLCERALKRARLLFMSTWERKGFRRVGQVSLGSGRSRGE